MLILPCREKYLIYNIQFKPPPTTTTIMTSTTTTPATIIVVKLNNERTPMLKLVAIAMKLNNNI